MKSPSLLPLPSFRKNTFSALGFGLMLAATANAQTVITSFTDLPTFNTAIGAAPVTIETFPSQYIPISSGILNSLSVLPAGGAIQPGVTYSTPISTGNFFNIDSGGGFPTPFLDTVTGNGPVTATFNGTVSAFGFDTTNLMGSTFSVTINFTSGSPFTSAPITILASDALNPTYFFGFQSTSSNITSAVILGTSGTFSFAIDNFRFTNANVTAIPEPGTTALLGSGLLGLALLQRRRRLA